MEETSNRLVSYRESFSRLYSHLSLDFQIFMSQINFLIGLPNIIKYLDLLKHWNSKIDLVSPAEEVVLFERHILDSAAAWLLIQSLISHETKMIYDIGSGAGLPGIIIACISSEVTVTLCEPREKRVQFLKQVVQEVNLKNVEIFQGAVEGLSPESSSRGLFVCRGLGRDAEFLMGARRVLKNGGAAAILAGPSFQISEEHVALKASSNVYEYSLLIGGSSPKTAPRRKLALFHVEQANPLADFRNESC